MPEFIYTFFQNYVDSIKYVGRSLATPSWNNFFYWTLFVSLIFMVWELIYPRQKFKKVFRKDYFLDLFYLVFNIFLLPILGVYTFLSLFHEVLLSLGWRERWIDVSSAPFWVQLLIYFVFRDFIHYWVHRLLHAVPFLWRVHELHHSVEEMGFSSHLRFHWMEVVVYRLAEIFTLGILGFGVYEFTIVYVFSLAWGHFNHANVQSRLGIFRYVFNYPEMHAWHHVKELPSKQVINFGITLSVWDYLFKTAWLPEVYMEPEKGVVGYKPTRFLPQQIYPFKRLKSKLF